MARSESAAQTSVQGLSDLQQRHQREAIRSALRALLAQPLMGPGHAEFANVRRHAEPLREWFQREAGWTLAVDREGARLHKRPGRLDDATRGLADFDRRRYVLLCLVCTVLERAEVQISLRDLGDQLLRLAADPDLVASGFRFELRTQVERRELVAVCRRLLSLGVLERVAGDEEHFTGEVAAQGDALYDIQRRVLAGMLAGVRGPSTWPKDAAPVELEARLHSLVDEHVADSDEGRRTAIRHRLARRLLDDPVVYLDDLDEAERTYFINQRGPLAARLAEATGLVAEQRAEGLALVDEDGELTDVAMPSEGTDAHVTLLAAEYLAARIRGVSAVRAKTPPTTDPLGRGAAVAGATPDGVAAVPLIRVEDVADHLRQARDTLGRYWRKSAREAGSERELCQIALTRLEQLGLTRRVPGGIEPRPALARFSLGEVRSEPAPSRPLPSTTDGLF